MPSKELLEAKMMRRLASEMDNEDIMKLKWFCRGLGTFSKAEFSNLNDFESIFFALKSKEAILLGSYGFLVDLFQEVDRPDLKTIVTEAELSMANSDYADGSGATRASAVPGVMIQHSNITSGIGAISNIQANGGSVNITIGRNN